MHINDLPEDVLRLLLGRFPLTRLLQLRRTCSTWCNVIVALCRGKHSLKLSITVHRRRRYHQFENIQNLTAQDLATLNFNSNTLDALCLSQSNVSSDLIHFLSMLLPGVTDLVVSIELHPGVYKQFAQLLNSWPNLESIALYALQNVQLLVTPDPKVVYKALARQGHLTSLTLKLDHHFSATHLASLGTDLLDRLESLTLHQVDVQMAEIIGRLGAACSRLALEPTRDVEAADWPSPADLESAQYPGALTSLKVHLSSERSLRVLCDQFFNLAELDLTFPLLPMDLPQFAHFQRLFNLTSLALNNFNLLVDISATNFDPQAASNPTITKINLANFGFAHELPGGNGRLLVQTLAILFPSTVELVLRSPLTYYMGTVDETELVVLPALKKYQIFLGNLYKENC